MPLPLLLAYLIAAAKAALAEIIRRLLLRLVGLAAVAALKLIQDRLRDWLERWLPDIALYFIKATTGLELSYPVTPDSLTQAINQRLGYAIFTDITDRDAVERDIGVYASRAVNDVLPYGLEADDFKNNITARGRLQAKIKRAMKQEIIGSWESGGGNILNADGVVETLALARGSYSWRPHVNIDDLDHEIGRTMAKWYRAHLTRTRIAR